MMNFCDASDEKCDVEYTKVQIEAYFTRLTVATSIGQSVYYVATDLDIYLYIFMCINRSIVICHAIHNLPAMRLSCAIVEYKAEEAAVQVIDKLKIFFLAIGHTDLGDHSVTELGIRSSRV
jgi:hypothetical protein